MQSYCFVVLVLSTANWNSLWSLIFILRFALYIFYCYIFSTNQSLIVYARLVDSFITFRRAYTSNLSTVGDRAFPIVAARVWNTLSPDVR